MMSVRYLTFIFAGFVVLFAFLFIPASVMLAWSGSGEKITYSKVDGTIRHMVFSDLNVDNVYIGDASFDAHILPVLLGGLSGHATFSGTDRQGHMQVSYNGTDMVQLEDLTVVTPLQIQTRFGRMSGLLRLQTQQSDISLNEGCQLGIYDVSTSIFDQFFAFAGFDAVQMSGIATCVADGMLDITLTGQSDAVMVRVTGQIASVQNWSQPTFALDMFIEPPVNSVFSPAVDQVFERAGLRPSGRGYRFGIISDSSKG